jgi:glutaredoxin
VRRSTEAGGAVPAAAAPAGRPPRAGARAAIGLLLGLAAALPAQALYKVVGPDGKVTYTDRPPSGAQSQVTPLTPAGGPAPAEAALPLELRQVAARYPVTLYVVADCPPCDDARTLLRQRGIPYAEKLVASSEDGDALQRIAGTRDAPTLTVGTQPLRGLAADVWNFYLDSAGYPRESRLPAGWRYPPATPLVERREAVPPAGPPASGAADASPDAPAPDRTTPAAGSRIRF